MPFVDRNPPALVAARKNSPDWQEAHGVSFGLRIGQLGLKVDGAKERLAAMQPEHREAVVALVQRWVDLDREASALVGRIDSELAAEVAANA